MAACLSKARNVVSQRLNLAAALPKALAELQELRAAGVTHALAVMEDFELYVSKEQFAAHDITVLQIRVSDYCAPNAEEIDLGVAFIRANVESGVHVQCKGGKGRSVVMVLCYLMAKYGWSAERAFEELSRKHRAANLRGFCGLKGQWRAVKRFERESVWPAVGSR